MAEEVETGVVRWLTEGLRAVLLAGLYVAGFFFVVLLLQALLLEEHGIAFSSFSIVLVLALVTAKVVVILDRAPIGHRIGLVEIAVRTSLYTLAAIAFAGYLTFAVARRKLGDRVLSNAFLGRPL